MKNPIYLERIIFRRFRGFWLKKYKIAARKYSKRADPLKLVKLIPAKFLYFWQIKSYLKLLVPKYLYCFGWNWLNLNILQNKKIYEGRLLRIIKVLSTTKMRFLNIQRLLIPSTKTYSCKVHQIFNSEKSIVT